MLGLPLQVSPQIWSHVTFSKNPQVCHRHLADYSSAYLKLQRLHHPGKNESRT